MPTFLFLGSGEFEPWGTEVEATALADAVGDGSVAILPTASASEGDHTFERWGRMGLDHYRGDGVPATVVPVKTREDADRNDLAASVEAAYPPTTSSRSSGLAACSSRRPTWSW